MKYYGKSSDSIAKLLKSDFSTGLSDKEAKKRLSRFGKNIIFDNGEKQAGKVALKLIYDPVSILLLISALICFSYTSTNTAVLILVMWALNLFITIAAYFKAEDILYTVKSYGIPKMKVLRDSKVYMLDSRLIVPGDILLIEAGDIICADCKIISAQDLTVYESDLCGTSDPVSKYPCEDLNAVKLSEMHGMLFASSSVISGHAVAVAVACGQRTEIVASAGLIPVCGKHYPDLFFKIKKRCRTWGLITTLCTIVIFIIKMLTDANGIFDAFLMIVALMGASMSEAMLPLSKISAAREISAAAQTGKGNRVIIKNAGSIEYLRDISVFVATEEITEFENMDFLSSLKEKGIKAIICCSQKKAFALATKYGASVCTSYNEIVYAKGTLAVFVADSIDSKLNLLKQLKKKGETVGALTTRLDCIRLLSEADVAFTYGKFKYKTNEYSKIYLESISGSQNQILSRVSDVICEENMLSTYRAVSCAKGIYSTVSSGAAYLITMQSARVLLCIITLFSNVTFIHFTHILTAGMLLDLCVVLTFSFFSNKSLYIDKVKNSSAEYIPSLIDAVILAASVLLMSSVPYILGIASDMKNAASVTFVGFLIFPVLYMIFITKNRRKNGVVKTISAFFAFVVFIISALFIFRTFSAVLCINITWLTLALSCAGALLAFLLINIRRSLMRAKTN